MAAPIITQPLNERDASDGVTAPRAGTFRERHGRAPRVLLLSAPFPSAVEPGFGVFVKERAKAVAERTGFEMRVVSPIPYFPPIKALPKWYAWSQFPHEEQVDGLQVSRVRYPLPPKIGGYVHPQLMSPFLRRAIGRIRREFDFDLIDAHFVYPSGAAAVALARQFHRPVVITGRGEDMHRFPSLPLIGGAIRKTLPQATRLIAVSREIASAMVTNGADPARVTVIPNGVDAGLFHPIDRDEARRRLGIDKSGPLLVSVGDRVKDKGLNLLIDALPRIREQFPTCKLAIVGGPARSGVDQTPVLEELIARHHLSGQVLLPGRCPHADLPLWYGAADLFVLTSAREGSSNALLEALACGAPAVATRAGEAPELLANSRLGRLIETRTADGIAAAVLEALACDWDRAAVCAGVASRTWSNVAEQVAGVFEAALAEFDATQHGERTAPRG